MKISLFSILSLVLLMLGCRDGNSTQNGGQANIDSTKQTQDSSGFFPVTNFLKGQIKELDALQSTPLQYVQTGQQQDSFWLKKETFIAALQPFLLFNIQEKNLQPFFKETSFNDQTLDAITLTYEPKTKLPDSIGLRSWNVYVNPTTGKVTKIFIVNNIKGTPFQQQLTWTTDRSVNIVTIRLGDQQQSEVVRTEKIIWGFD